jgi:hypothetical protein
MRRMVFMLDAQTTLRSRNYITICKIIFAVRHFFATLQATTIAIAATVRVQYLWVNAFGYHWPRTETVILHAYRPVGAGLIT